MSVSSRSQPFCSPYGRGTRAAFSEAESGYAAALPPPERFALRQNASRAAPPREFSPTYPESGEYALSQRLRRFADVGQKSDSVKAAA